MSKVFVNIGLSPDGDMAPDGMTMENPGYKNWGAKWGALMAWLLNQLYMRENLKFGSGGETDPVNDLVRRATERIGANIMGKRMFDQGERTTARSGRALQRAAAPSPNAIIATTSHPKHSTFIRNSPSI